MNNEGFIDLRVESHNRGADDNVWPSFTDIMTVVVMIFLMALVVILIRNVELVDQLRATMDAERAAAEIARTTEEQKISLASQVGNLEEQVFELRLQILKAKEIQAATAGELEERISQLADVETERDDLQTEKGRLAASQELLQKELSELVQAELTLSAEKAQLQKELSTVQLSEAELNREKARLEQDLDAVGSDLSILRKSHSAQEDELVDLRKVREGEKQRLLSLQGEYTVLKGKYDRLIRPARTPLGKYLVEVRYRKSGGGFLIELREPGQADYKLFNRVQLHDRLGVLKAEKGRKLYTKIVIPDDSGLSYEDAWTFTQDVLSKYDYYYQ